MKKNFTFRKEQLEYTLKLRKRRPWWWLLLLLLPLLLLLRFEKDIYVKTVDTAGNPVANATVHFDYYKSFAYAGGRFFTNDQTFFTNTTNTAGVAGFVQLKYSLFSWLFHHSSPAGFTVIGNCYSSDSSTHAFHSLSEDDTVVLKLNPVFVPLDFRVIDKDDSSELPDARVHIVSEIGGIQYDDSAVTDASGKVFFKRFPKCGKLIKVVAKLEGYYPDSLTDKTASELAGPKENRMLKLKPIRKPVEFFVVDCKSGEPIAGANVTIEFDYDGKRSRKFATTNVDGKGKGTYSEAHVIAKIHLIGSHPYYETGELQGWHLVSDFIQYPKEKRTFCLEPKDTTIYFINVDSVTRKPLAGVQNHITIERNGKKIKAGQPGISNRNGIFAVNIQKGDKVFILSQHPPDYEDNDRKVNDHDALDLLTGPQDVRTIPLMPKVFEKPPKQSCRVFVSGKFVGDEFEGNYVSEIYQIDDASEYVGEGVYPDNTIAFPKAVRTSFDGIAIDKGTRVIIYSEKNFQGTVLLDRAGPAIINNGARIRKGDKDYLQGTEEVLDKINSGQFKEPLQKNFPQSTREISATNMIPWSYGSMRVICNN